MIDPAVNGTLYACRAAAKHGVKRLVLTSSTVSIMYNNDKSDIMIDANHWTDEKYADPYSVSKMLAEKAAWAHQKECGMKYELATINPGGIMGTPIIKGRYSSADIAVMFLTGKGPMPALPPMYMPFVDVDNVAMAHYKAMVTPEAAGKRFVMGWDVVPSF